MYQEVNLIDVGARTTFTQSQAQNTLISQQQMSSTDLILQEYNSHNKAPFTYSQGLPLTFLIGLILIIFRKLKQGGIHFFSFFIFKKPFRSLKITNRVKIHHSQPPIGRKFLVALKGPGNFLNFTIETLTRFCLIVTITSCVCVAFLQNKCLFRQTTSTECKNVSHQQGYISGLVVGLICTLLQLKFDIASLNAFIEYSKIFEFEQETSQDKEIQKPIDNQKQSFFDTQSQNTIQGQSERTTLIASAGINMQDMIKVAGENYLQKISDNKLLPICEDDDDEQCSPLKNQSQKKRSDINLQSSNRSQEHFSPTKGAVQFDRQLMSNQSVDNRQLVIKSDKKQISNEDQTENKIDQEDNLELSLHQTQTDCENNTIQNEKRKQSFCFGISDSIYTIQFLTGLTISTTILTLYYFANLTSDGISVVWISISIALSTNIVFQIPLFSYKYLCLKSLAQINQQNKDQIQVLNEFWQQFQHQSEGSIEIVSQKIQYKNVQLFHEKDNQKVRYQNQILSRDSSKLMILSESNQIQNDEESVPYVKPFIINSEGLIADKSINFQLTNTNNIVPPPNSRSRNNFDVCDQIDTEQIPNAVIDEVNFDDSGNQTPEKYNIQLKIPKEKQPGNFETPKQFLSENTDQARVNFISTSLLEIQIAADNILSENQKQIASTPEQVKSQQTKPQNQIQENLNTKDSVASQNKNQAFEIIRSVSGLVVEGYEKLIRSISHQPKSIKKEQDKSQATLQQNKIEKSKKGSSDGHEFSPMWSSALKHDSYRKYQTQGNDDVRSSQKIKSFGINDGHLDKIIQQDSPLAELHKRQVSNKIVGCNEDYSDVLISTRKKYRSPGSANRRFKDKEDQQKMGSLKSQRNSSGFQYGAENTTARKRRLMLLEDAACSSVNFQGSEAKKSNAQNSSIGTRQIHFYSLGSLGSPKKKEGLIQQSQSNIEQQLLLLKTNESIVEIGAGNINEDEDFDVQVQQAYQNQQAEAILELSLPQDQSQNHTLSVGKSDNKEISGVQSQTKKVAISQNSELDSNSYKPTILGFQKSDFSDPQQSPKEKNPTAFQKLVNAANKALDAGRNGKRSHSVNQTTEHDDQKQKKQKADPPLFKQPFLKKVIDRRTSEPACQKQLQCGIVTKNISALSSQQKQHKTPDIRLSLERIQDDPYASVDKEVQNVVSQKINLSRVRNKGLLQNNSGLRLLNFQENTQPNLDHKKMRLFTKEKHQTLPPPQSKELKRDAIIKTQQSQESVESIRDPTSSCYHDFAEKTQFNLIEETKIQKFQKQSNHWEVHMGNQLSRLLHFLTVAKQVRAQKDVNKIRELIREIHETGRALPYTRINELKSLDIMTSPYNQTLLAMLKQENYQLKKLKEFEQLQPTQISQTDQNQVNSESEGSFENHNGKSELGEQVNSRKQSRSQIERVKNSGSSLLRGPQKMIVFATKHKEQPCDVYQIQSKIQPLQNDDAAFQLPKSSLGYIKPDLQNF